MQSLDYVKAFLTAMALLVINVAISYAVVAVYAYLIEPGHEDAFYEAAAQDIAPWSSVIFGVILFYLAGQFFARRKPARNATAFALSIAASYAAIDMAIVVSLGAFSAIAAIFVLSMTTKALAGYLGARSVATNRQKRVVQLIQLA